MRVGLVCPYAMDVPGGVQNHVLGLASWLFSHDHDSYVLTCGDVNDSYDLHGLPRERITSVGRSTPVAFNRSVARVVVDPRAFARVSGWVNGHDFDVVSIHEPLVPVLSLAALRSPSVPIVGTFHAAGPDAWPARFAGRMMRRRLDGLSGTTAVSQTAAKTARRHFAVSPEIVPNGLFVPDLSPVPAGRWRGGSGPRITFLGRWDEPRKGLDVLLSAAPSIRYAWPTATITVAGYGHTALPPWVETIQRPTDTQRNQLLEQTDVFVAPNTGRESFGLIVVEALASGALVVASDIEGFRDVLSTPDGAVGELFTPHDAAGLAARVDTALRGDSPSHPEQRRARAMQFDWNVVGPAYLSIFARSVNSFGKSPIA